MALIAEAERLKDQTEWKNTTEALIQLQHEWKAAPSAGNKEDQKLWLRFRAACDFFFEAKKEYYATLDDRQAENRTSIMYVPYVSRMDYAAGMFYEAIVVNAPERLEMLQGMRMGAPEPFFNAVLDVARLPAAERARFPSQPLPGQVRVSAPTLPEPHAAWVDPLEREWTRRYGS